MTMLSAYQSGLKEHNLAYELLKRKLRTSIVRQIIRILRPKDLRYIYYSLHKERPISGVIPSVEAIPHTRESFLYMALFASIYRSASRVDIKTDMDINAIVFAWDYFCKTFPGHIRERRPYGRIRPANFDEAWVIAHAIKNGSADLQYCSACKRNFFIIYCTNYPPICQICVMRNVNSKGATKSSILRHCPYNGLR